MAAMGWGRFDDRKTMQFLIFRVFSVATTVALAVLLASKDWGEVSELKRQTPAHTNAGRSLCTGHLASLLCPTGLRPSIGCPEG